jgi:prepilin-type N-terminal cleavage/methylation domain-containing protein
MKGKKKEKGFTLIEVLAGVVIMSVGLLLLLPMMVTSINANSRAQSWTEASMLIKDKMEDLKNMETPTSGNDAINGATRTWTVSNAGTNLTRLVVSIAWLDDRGRTHTNSMTSYKASR